MLALFFNKYNAIKVFLYQNDKNNINNLTLVINSKFPEVFENYCKLFEKENYN